VLPDANKQTRAVLSKHRANKPVAAKGHGCNARNGA
jgi:hypothetical protein